MGAFEDYISGSFQGLARGARELPENIANWARPAAQEGIKGYDGAITGTDLPYYGDDEISAAREQFDKQPRSNTSRLVDLIGNYMPGAVASKAAPVAVRAGETVLGAGPAFKQKVAETALDMAPETRAARASEMGFDLERPLYHGTAADIDAFNAGPGKYGRGVYLTDQPRSASGYADLAARDAGGSGANVMPVVTSMKNPLDRWLPMTPKMRETLSSAAQGNPAAMSAIRDARTVGAALDGASAHLGRDAGDLAQSLGFDAIRADAGPIETYTIALDPSNVRSRFAVFDPAKAGSSDLLAAHANPLSQLQQMYRNREEQ